MVTSIQNSTKLDSLKGYILADRSSTKPEIVATPEVPSYVKPKTESQCLGEFANFLDSQVQQ
jgi:hypothetical protein